MDIILQLMETFLLQRLVTLVTSKSSIFTTSLRVINVVKQLFFFGGGESGKSRPPNLTKTARVGRIKSNKLFRYFFLKIYQ